MNTHSSQQPEFLLNCHRFFGFPVGRFYLPAYFARYPQFQLCCKSVHILEEKLYLNGDKVIWFIASIEEYQRLSGQFPHSTHCQSTKFHLKLLSTLVDLLKLLSDPR